MLQLHYVFVNLLNYISRTTAARFINVCQYCCVTYSETTILDYYTTFV